MAKGREMERYRSYKELKKNEILGQDYRIRNRDGSSGIVVIAPHGGGIEPGTTEIAEAVAGRQHRFYTFSGIKSMGNSDLHITSTNFNEPEGLRMVERSRIIIAIHGCREREKLIFTGGRDKFLKEKIGRQLTKEGFEVSSSNRFPGVNLLNICNRSRLGMGVQLEISVGLRRDMFEEISRIFRKQKTPVFDQFIRAVRAAIADY